MLIQKLKKDFGIQGDVLQWIESYLSKRTYRVKIKDSKSILFYLLYGVPQGSLLGPLLFILYVKELEKIAKNHGLSIHVYADDSQLYISIDMDNKHPTKERIEACLKDIQKWMVLNYLKINSDKTKMLLIRPKRNSDELTFTLIHDNEKVECETVAKSLGVTLDPKLDMVKFIQEKCRASYFHIRNLGRIKRSLSTDMRIKLVHNMILSKLDYCNSLLALVPNCHIKKLQKVQNTAVRLIYDVPKKTSTSKFLKEAHFLPIDKRIDYKLCSMMFGVMSGNGPTYISESFELFDPARNLRVGRDDCNMVYKNDKVNDIFKCMVAKWNILPREVRNSANMNLFKSRLKTHLFDKAFVNVV
jgi:hypothetical protein